MTTVKWGILSTARHAANTWIPQAHNSPSGEVVAVASRDPHRAQQFAAANNIPNSYGSYEALLADDTIDAVYIPLPNHMHKEWAIKAKEAGKHVMCEKPLGLNAMEAVEMVEAFKGSDLKFAEAFQWRHSRQAQRLRQIVQSGEIGDLRFIDAGFSFPLDREGDIRRNPETGGGALYDVGCYTVAATRFIADAEPLTVTAQIYWGDYGIDELVVATLEFPNHVLAHLNCSFILPLRRYYEAVCRDGSVLVEHAYNPNGLKNKVIQRGQDHEVVKTHVLGRDNEYLLLIEDFNRAVLDDRDPLYGGDDAIKNMKVIDAIYKASETGTRVEVG
ncbi:MAG: Gfo/Idh/MocA family oxidoreductase [Anaerolineae bacterium]|nr:Gfo/Idh/MocA family oxidoreductase [Anaerolineae bacterium]